MEREVNKNMKGLNVEKIVTEPFDGIIGHSDSVRKYFTNEKNDIIYKRLKSELSIEYLPYLGPCVGFGMGGICLEESRDKFKFYIIDRTSKFEYEEIYTIEDAIQKLISYYQENELVDNPNKMEEIFYHTLGLDNQTKETIVSTDVSSNDIEVMVEFKDLDKTTGPVKILNPNNE